jgi:hypothetical protein
MGRTVHNAITNGIIEIAAEVITGATGIKQKKTLKSSK